MDYTIDDINRYVRRFYAGAPVLVTPFSYPLVLNADGTPATFNVQANADFVLTRVAYKISQDVQWQDKMALVGSLTLRESGSKEPFFEPILNGVVGVFVENYCENGVGSRSLGYPRFLAGGTNVEASVTNQAGQVVEDGGVELLFDGFMVRVFSAQ